MVRIHAQTTRPATPQRTALKRLQRADADDGPGDGVRGAHRDAAEDGHDQRGGRPGLGAEAVHRPQVDDPLPHRLDDAPAAEQRAQSHGRVAGQHHFGGHLRRARAKAWPPGWRRSAAGR